MRSGHSRRYLYYPVKKPPTYFLKRAGSLYFPGILPCSRFRENIYNSTEVSQVASFRPRRGRTPNNRRWNDRREWNLRIVTDTLLPSPKGANRSKTGCGSPPLGTLSPYYWLSAGSMTFGHSTSGYSHSPPLGTQGYLVQLEVLRSK